MAVDASFVRIAASWSVAEALDVLDAVPARFVVVHRLDDSGESFYVWSASDARQRFARRRDATVHVALDLRDSDAVPIVPVDGTLPSTTAVVIDRGTIVGVSDGAGPSAPRGHQRKLAASAPGHIAFATQATVLVTLTADLLGPGSEIDAAVGSTIDLVAIASGTVELVGPAQDSFLVEDLREQHKQFAIRGREVGDGRIEIYAFRDRVNVARISVTTRVMAASPGPISVRDTAEVRAVDTPPDLAIWIQEDRHAHTYMMRVTSADSSLGLNLAPFGPIVLGGDVDRFFTTFYDEIEAILVSSDSPQDKFAELGQKGLYLFEKVVPRDLRLRLWQIRDHIKSVQIQSEEPWVPWELCKLSGKDADGTIADGDFLAERYQVTRWFPGMPQYKHLTMRSIGLVVPPDSGLAAAPAENTAMLELAGPDRTVTSIAARSSDLRAALASQRHDAFHFVGHGAYAANNADRSAIKLEGGRRFSPEDLAGRVANFGAAHPLVFLNACEVGRAGTALGGTAGWPQAFVGAGAAAFIGPFWKIADGSGSRFAALFYQQLLDEGATVGQAIHHARTEIRKASDPTWLAYVAYAHPEARVVAT